MFGYVYVKEREKSSSNLNISSLVEKVKATVHVVATQYPV